MIAALTSLHPMDLLSGVLILGLYLRVVVDKCRRNSHV